MTTPKGICVGRRRFSSRRIASPKVRLAESGIGHYQRSSTNAICPSHQKVNPSAHDRVERRAHDVGGSAPPKPGDSPKPNPPPLKRLDSDV
jgi:hypothetical protein